MREGLIQTLSEQLLFNNKKLATVESCTGGLLAAQLTAVAGSSTWFEGGFVTYSNHSKMRMVGVKESSLLKHGAVSKQVALEMAMGGLNNIDAQCVVSITGIAGPAGGTANKPVGTVCFAWAGFGSGSKSERCQFVGNREQIRQQSMQYALNIACKLFL